MLSNNTPVLVGIAAQWVAKRSPNLSLFSIHLIAISRVLPSELCGNGRGECTPERLELWPESAKLKACETTGMVKEWN